MSSFLEAVVVDPTSLATQLEGKSDKWFFIATLVTLGLFGFATLKYLLGRLEKITDSHEASMVQHSQVLLTIVSEQAVLIARVAKALEEGSEERARMRLVLERLPKT